MRSADPDRVDTVERDGICTVFLHYPEGDGLLDVAQVGSLRRRLRDALDSHAGLVVLAAEGPDFCVGLAQVEGGRRHDVASQVRGLLMEVRAFPVPIVAQLRGRCAGFGLALALLADVRLAEMNSLLSVRDASGSLPPGLAWALRRTVGHARAARLLLTGAELTATEAAGAGVVDEVVDDAELAVRTEEVAMLIAAQPRRVRSAVRRVLVATEELPFDEAMTFDGWLWTSHPPGVDE